MTDVLAASIAMSWSPDRAKSAAISAALTHSCLCRLISSAGDRLRCPALPPPPPARTTVLMPAVTVEECEPAGLESMSMDADPTPDASVPAAAHCVADAAANAAVVLWERERLARRGGGFGVSITGVLSSLSAASEGAVRFTLERRTATASDALAKGGNNSVTVDCRSIASGGGGGGAACRTSRVLLAAGFGDDVAT